MARRTQNASAQLPEISPARIYPGSQTAKLLAAMAANPGWRITIAAALASVPARLHRTPRAQAREIVRTLTERGLICPDLHKNWAAGQGAKGLSPEELGMHMTLSQLGRDMLRHHLPDVAICKPQFTHGASRASHHTPAAPHPPQDARISALPHRGSPHATAAGPYIRPGALDFLACESLMGTRHVPRPHHL